MNLLAVDPGAKNLGWALFEDQYLHSAGLARTKRSGPEGAQEIAAAVPRADRGVVEHMTHRRGKKNSVPQVLIDLQGVGWFVMGACCSTFKSYTATQWKGNVPKRIHHARILEVLTEHERIILDLALAAVPKGNHKEILDACGLGLFELGRLSRGGR